MKICAQIDTGGGGRLIEFKQILKWQHQHQQWNFRRRVNHAKQLIVPLLAFIQKMFENKLASLETMVT